jgi:hypothetical protein
MRLFLRAARLALGATLVAWAAPACYTAGGGSGPPLTSFYFPTGLAVSSGGNVLYAINSDFDLQWSGGTLQSYDLYKIRLDATTLVQSNLYPYTCVNGSAFPVPDPSGKPPPDTSGIPFLTPYNPSDCVCGYPPLPAANGRGIYLGQACAPPIDSSKYVRDSVIVGAFATDLQVSTSSVTAIPANTVTPTRLFAPVGGNATVTWANIAADDQDPTTEAAPDGSLPTTFHGFAIDCGVLSDQRCDGSHQTGNDPNSTHNTRNVTMPGQPFGMAQSEDGAALAVTSEVATKTSLLTSGLNWTENLSSPPGFPTMQFVLDGLPTGGVGITAVPHDPDAVRRCEDVNNVPPCVRQAFLQTSRSANEIDLLRYYDDDGSSLQRPFLSKEASFSVTANSNGSDSRGIAIDLTPRLACKHALPPSASSDQLRACGQLPANVFIANRTPATIVVGQIGHLFDDGTYDPDYLTIIGNVPLTDGPSKVYLAPIVNAQGNYELRVFVVCYDSNTVYVLDPNDLVAGVFLPLGVIPTGQGPYALAFDHFSLEDVAYGNPVKTAANGLKRYRYMYVASFRQSYVQVVDLDESSPITFQRDVFTLGQPTWPKGT